MDLPSWLLVLGQTFFMVLPLTGFWSMHAGRPSPISWIKGINHSVATLGFITLIVMFSMKGAWLGVRLCSINLGLRLLEWVRILQLHFKKDAAQLKSLPLQSPRTGLPRIKFRLIVKVILGAVVGWALLFEGHHISCKLSVQLCTNLLLQTSQMIGMVHDGRADRWRHRAAKTAPACSIPSVTFDKVVASYRTKHPGSTWLHHEYNTSRVPPKWAILLSSQASGSTWVRTELSR
jgi:hypothetical protein